MRLLIMGPPGAGKGSQAVLIKEKYKIPSISTGDMFRENIKNNTRLGKLANEFIKNGDLVPDDVTNLMVKDRLSHDDCKRGFLLDGFPRNIDQATSLDEILKEMNTKLDLVINLIVDEEIIIKRISGRRLCSNCGASYHIVNHPPKVEGVCDVCGETAIYQREDDNEEIIKNRVKVYSEQTKPLLDYYLERDLLINIDGARLIDEIFEELIPILGGINDFN